MVNNVSGATSERRSKRIFIASTVTGFSFDGCFDKKKRLVGPVVVVDLTWSVVCVVFSPIRIIFRLSSPLAFISLFTRLVTFVHAYKIYCSTKILFHLTFWGLNFSVSSDTHK